MCLCPQGTLKNSLIWLKQACLSASHIPLSLDPLFLFYRKLSFIFYLIGRGGITVHYVILAERDVFSLTIHKYMSHISIFTSLKYGYHIHKHHEKQENRMILNEDQYMKNLLVISTIKTQSSVSMEQIDNSNKFIHILRRVWIHS